jgi:hypothetical protein
MTKGKVVEFGNYAGTHIPPERIKEHVEWSELKDVLVIGVTKEDALAAWGSTTDVKEMLWITHSFIKEVL